jgi:EAL domain-containing protein (putative c-di-GMP-specific phosphodiesterase class I)
LASVREEDTVSRLGGDEYVVIVEGLGQHESGAAAQAEQIAEKIRAALAMPYLTSATGQVSHSTPSIGVTLFHERGHSLDVLFKQADVALYQAKGAGRNTIRFFSPEMQAAIDSRSAMEAELHMGLELHEFQLYYQPQVDQAGHLTGAEALLRWLPTNRPTVSPAQFIPLAEDSGLIIPIGLWVLQTACAQIKAWDQHQRTRDLQIAVNISARQLRQPNFVDQVRDCLQKAQINPARLKLELTESVVLDDVDLVIGRMQQIRTLGVTFSLDDFGTGFSSLSYLKRLPLDQVKIDQSFIRDITTDPNDAAIVSAIIAMSNSLGLQVIAEGVETEAQLAFLRDSGCMHYQGYLLGKPAPIGDWQQFL